MYQTIGESLFIQRFKDYGREKDFSLNGLKSLFSYLEFLEDDSGIKVELDVIDICCKWSEAHYKEVLRDFWIDSLEDLKKETTVLELENGNILYQSF